MISKALLKQIILEQEAEESYVATNEISRLALSQVQPYQEVPHVIVFPGVRRSGKSTMMRQLRKQFYDGQGYYLSFEDERLLAFGVEDFNVLYEVFLELYGEQKIFFLDEIQNILDWEVFVRRMHDRGYKFFLTGSNASMLSKEMGTRLTGRSLSLEVYPFSFQEYLIYQKVVIESRDLYKTKAIALIQQHFRAYLNVGGFPEYVQFRMGQILQRIYEDILYRDIIVRHKISAVKELRELCLYLFSNIGTLISFNKLKQMLQLGSVNTVKKLIQFLEDSYLFFTINRFSYSMKQQIIANKKVYCVDNGMANHIGLRFSENTGRLLENLVFIELKKQGHELFFYKTAGDLEVDFLIREGSNIKALIQVSQTLADKTTRDREINSLCAAMDELQMARGLVLTLDTTELLQIGSKQIEIKPIYQWLLEVHEKA